MADRRPGAAAAPFAPTDVAGLKLWLKADGTLWQDSARTTPATLDGDPVGAWDDGSGAGNHALQATAAARPTLRLTVQNGRPAVRSDGVDDRLQTGAFVLNQPSTVAVVARRTGGAAQGYYLDGRVVNTRVMQYANATTMRLYAGVVFDSTVAVQASFFAALAVFNGASSVLRFNGVETTGNASTLNASGLTLFTSGDAAVSPLGGDVGEILLYDSALSPADRVRVGDYLKLRWGTP